MAKKKAISPEKQRYLAAIDEVVDLCRDPAHLDLIRRFCQILYRKMDSVGRVCVTQVIATGKPGCPSSFPESFLAAEAREAEKRQAAAQRRRMTLMLKKPAGAEARPDHRQDAGDTGETRRAGNEA